MADQLSDVERAIIMVKVKATGYQFAQLYLDTLEKYVALQRKVTELERDNHLMSGPIAKDIS